MTANDVTEFPGKTISGGAAFGIWVVGLLANVFVYGLIAVHPIFVLPAVLMSVLMFFSLGGFFVLQPNQAMVLILFGKYTGTIKDDGWWWVNPFTAASRRGISQRVHNFTTETSKVNDAVGNPIEIAAVVVWRVVDTARAQFRVEDYEDFVAIQSETAIRFLGTEYPYDNHGGDGFSLRSDPEQVAQSLHSELQDRLDDAGVEVIETRLTHLAYAPEIAEAMLRRQQAAAVVAARRTIVEGAVGMVEDALEMLAEHDVVELDEERKASMVSNLLVVLTSENNTQPIVNAGSLY